MAQAGIIKTITGIVNARTSDGQVRQLMAGDMVYENEIIETTAGSKVTIELNDGKTLAMAENDQIALDETVLAAVDAQDAVVTEVDALQAALEAGEEIPEEEPAAGDEDEGHDYDLGYYAGDQSGGEVGSRLTPTEYGVQEETFEDIDGEEEDTIVITPDPALSAVGVVVDETDIETANTATGTITVDYGTPTGTLALSAAGATWDAVSNTLTYQQDGTNIWQIALDQDTGGFTFEQLAAFDHAPDANEPDALKNFGVTVLATNSFGNTATTTFTAGIEDDGPKITGSNEIISAELGTVIPSSDIIGVVTGNANVVSDPANQDDEFGTDGPGEYSLMNGGVKVSEIETSDYKITMDSEGNWTFHQYQPANDTTLDLETLNFEFRIYDEDGDWKDGTFDVPVSQFIVGSNPQEGEDQYRYDGYGEGEDQYRYDGYGEGEGEGWYGDDVENFVENDHHEVNPTGVDVQGAILGQDGADTLVGDPGGSTQTFNNNYIIAMDISDSLVSRLDTTHLDNVKQATIDMIDTLYAKVMASTNGEIKINIMPFADAANDNANPNGYIPSAWVIFDKNGTTVDITNSSNITTDIEAWINSLSKQAGTNYEAALTGANDIAVLNTGFDSTHVIFMSDGLPEAGPTAHLDELTTLQTTLGYPGNPDGNTIRAIGINMDPKDADPLTTQPIDILNAIDDNDAIPLESGFLSEAIAEIIAGIDLHDAGNDEIYGNDGNDLIFGDVMNTDGVFADLDGQGYDLSDIEHMIKGSGWDVFEALENANPDTWTRADTIQYIQDNHEDLAIETVADGNSREGGSDYIEGGEGDDIIYGQEGNDTIDAGAGDDVIDGGTGTNTIDGGTGYDTLMVDQADEGTGGVLDFSNVDNIELINLNDPGVVQNVEISLNDVFDMTDDNHVLQITGEGTDTVFLTGVGTAAGDWEQDGTDPNSFTQIVAGDSPGSASGPTVTIDPLSDGIDIQVDVDNSTGDFAV